MRFNFIDFKLFVNVIESGSITRGAERSHLALAAASTRIRNMELSLGAPLLLRTGRGIATTPAGGTLLHHARIILREIECLRGALGHHVRHMKGYVRLLANTNALAELLPEVLIGFLEIHPQINVDLEERPSNEIVGAIAEGMGDIGIFAGPIIVPELECFHFRSDRLVLVTGTTHPLHDMEEIAMVDGLNHEFIGLRRGSAIQNFLTEIAAKTGKELKMRARLDSFDAICRMAERNIGIGVVPSSAAERCSRTMDIHIVRLTDPWATRELNVAVRKACELSPQAKLLLNYLKQASLCGRKPDLDLPAPAAAVAVASL